MRTFILRRPTAADGQFQDGRDESGCNQAGGKTVLRDRVGLGVVVDGARKVEATETASEYSAPKGSKTRATLSDVRFRCRCTAF